MKPCIHSNVALVTTFNFYVHLCDRGLVYMYNNMHDNNNYEPLTISPVAAQCNGICGKRSSIECVHIDRCWPQKSWRWRLRSTLNLDSDKFRCFNHRDELDSTVFLPNFRLVALLQSRAGQPLVTMMRAIYSARLSTALRKPRKHVKFNQ